jgi:ketosteroid isomerase-like protein
MSPEELLRRYFSVEMERDVEKILALYTPMATFATPERLRNGREEIRPFYEDAVERFPTLAVQITNAFDHGDWAVAEWSAEMTGTDGSVVPLSGVNVARFEHDLLAEVRSYYDTGAYLTP